MYQEPAKVNYAAIRAKVEAEFQCKHEQTEVRNKAASDGVPSIRHQCLRCGAKIGSVIPKRSMTQAQLAALPAWDALAEKQFYQAREKAIDDLAHTEQEKLDAARRRHYDFYIEGPDWKQKHDAVIARAHGICEGCGKEKATEAHHLTYSDFGDEFLFQLVALCEKCHVKWHVRHGDDTPD